MTPTQPQQWEAHKPLLSSVCARRVPVSHQSTELAYTLDLGSPSLNQGNLGCFYGPLRLVVLAYPLVVCSVKRLHKQCGTS